MISDDLTTICKFIVAMRDTDNGNELRINAENTDYVVAVLADAIDRVRAMECQIVPPALRECDVANDGSVINLATYRAQKRKRKLK